MARSLTSGTSTDGGGSTTTNMATLQATLRAAIIANAAWSLVETINGNANVVDVYKCAAASSGLSKDFYFALIRQISSGTYTFMMGEDYNSTTHVLSNLAPTWSGSARAVDATTGLFNPANTATFNATTGNITTSGATPIQAIANPAATITYAVITDVDHLVIRVGTKTMYVGAIDSYVTAVSDPMPLVFVSLSTTGSSSTGNSGSPRNPGLASGGVQQSHSLADGIVAQGSGELYPNAAIRDTTISDPWVGGVGSYEVGALNNVAANVGNLRGRLKKTRKVFTPPAGTAVGDTFTIGTRAWQVVGAATGAACIVDPGP